MSETSIASLQVGQEDPVVEVQVYQKWISRSFPHHKDLTAYSHKDRNPPTYIMETIAETSGQPKKTSDITTHSTYQPRLAKRDCYQLLQSYFHLLLCEAHLLEHELNLERRRLQGNVMEMCL